MVIPGKYQVNIESIGITPDGYTYVGCTPGEFIIEKATYDMSGITLDNKTVEYDGNIQYIVLSNSLPSGVSVTYTYYEVEDGNETLLESRPINAGSYKVYASFKGSDYYNEIATISAILTITPINVKITSTIIELDYSASYTSWDAISSAFSSKITITLSNGSALPTEFSYSILGMHNGVYKYSSPVGVSSLPKGPDIIVGSTYQVQLSISATLNGNYTFENGISYFILKYKTAKIDSTYYTIEDAFVASGNITFVGDASTESSYIITSFTALTASQGNPYSSFEFNLSGRTLRVPYEDSTNDYLGQYQNSLVNVYSALYIPKCVSITLKSSASFIIGAIIDQCGVVERRGVVMNYGTITAESGCNVKAYGYLKGTGSLILESGATALDVFYINDWPGAGDANSLKDKNAFPVQKWRVHNISCYTYIYSGAIYNSMSHIVALSGVIDEDITDIYIIGNTSTGNCLFKPSSSSVSTDYILKYASITGDSFIESNQKMNQKEIIEIHGDYIDANVNVSIKYGLIDYSMKTSTSMCVPIINFDITVKDNSTLTLTNASYAFLDANSKVEVEKGSTLCVNGNAFLAMMNNSELILNGTLSGTGEFGGLISTSTAGAKITISSLTANDVILKTSGANYSKQNVNSRGNVLTSKTTYSEKVLTDGAYTSRLLSDDIYVWTSDKVSIYLHPNGGTFADNATTILGPYDNPESGYYLSSIGGSTPSRAHYEFGGWYLDVECTISALNQYYFVNSYIYAKWIPIDYDITFVDVYKNFESTPAQNTYSDLTINAQVNTVFPVSPVNNTYVFVGWYLDAECTKRVFSSIDIDFDKYVVDGAITLYGLWYPEGTDVYVINYSNPNSDVDYVSIISFVITSSDDWSNIALQNFDSINSDYTKDKYFIGWYDNNDQLVTTLKDEIFTNFTLNLTAKWGDKDFVFLNYGEYANVPCYIIPGAAVLPSLSTYSGTGEETMVWFINSTHNSSTYYIGGIKYDNLASSISLYGEYYYMIKQSEINGGSYTNTNSYTNILLYNLNLDVLKTSYTAASVSGWNVGLYANWSFSSASNYSGAFYGCKINKIIVENCTGTESGRSGDYNVNYKTMNALFGGGTNYAYTFMGIFDSNPLEQVIISDESSYTAIGNYAFSNISGFTSAKVIVPSSLSSKTIYTCTTSSNYTSSSTAAAAGLLVSGKPTAN